MNKHFWKVWVAFSLDSYVGYSGCFARPQGDSCSAAHWSAQQAEETMASAEKRAKDAEMRCRQIEMELTAVKDSKKVREGACGVRSV